MSSLTDLPKKWAITGATGLLGNNLVRMLIERGADVSVLCRGGERRELEGLPVRVVDGDLESREALEDCMRGADVVVHAAAVVWIGYTRRVEMTNINVYGTRAVCEALPAGARLVYVSTVDAIGYGTPDNPSNEDVAPRDVELGVPYTDTKRAADQVVRNSGVDYSIVYPSYMFGPWDWKPSSGQMILRTRGLLALLPPPGTNNYVHVRDVCEGILRAANTKSGSRFILGNENLSYREVWTLISAATGGRRPRLELPKFVGSLASVALSLPASLGLPEPLVNDASTRYGFSDHCFDASRSQKELGLELTPVKTAIEEAWAWFQAYGYA